ncbi:Endoplasmic reticulum junction formation protein lunapark [Rhodotorula toruloides]|uniref:Endoplasmic reticulum junction formation protein lunapark n=1 Tax=Rhodotorula toruloides TaxID=5286 RepID=A0A0K3C8D3_RHOTO|nr:Endoplasmic reticulum junction formation protein lunapark [Rhodotorula toruloides]PRQ76657.1 putative integral membrane metal-binding protein (DUF2296)-domain containing protein [Rhodotorula toruloides]
MGALLSRPREPDYDSYLSKLQGQIAARQARLQQIRLRERRANALFITYGLGLWVLYAVLWYFGIVGVSGEEDWPTRAARGAPVVGGPVAIICTRRVSRWYFHRKQEKEEATLKTLVKQKQDKVEEIKKKTGYYTTRDLLEKYDEALKKGPGGAGSTPSTPAKQTAIPGVKATPQPVSFPGSPATPARPGVPPGFATPQQQRPGQPGSPATPAMAAAAAQAQAQAQAQMAFPPMPPPTPHTRSLMDKVADALLGVSPEEANPFNKYALICARCYSHNGLCPKEEFDFVQYRCPRCGYFNPPRRDPSSASNPSLATNDQARHRRVHSEFAPSPLSATFGADARPLSVASSGSAEGGSKAVEEREEEDSPTVGAVDSAGTEKEMKEISTTALKGGQASRRRGRRATDSDEEGDEDRMDTDE